MVGAGIVGCACAWLLVRRGHAVTLVEPPPPATAASDAALGVLMGQVFHRSGGRAWRLRQRGLALWSEWRRELAGRGHPIPHRGGLLLLAADSLELARQGHVARERRAAGLPLTLWDRERIARLRPSPPGAPPGGLHSAADGQLDPVVARRALRADGLARGLTVVGAEAVALEGRAVGWGVLLADGQRVAAERLVLTAAAASSSLLAGVGIDRPIEPVLGQALELEVPESVPPWRWPGALVWRGVNLVPRPDLPGGRRLWLGATVESGDHPDPGVLENLRALAGDAPPWLQEAKVVRRWHGFRPRPVGRPAPLLEEPAPGLVLASGHHRNGVLLAPATAEWVAARVEAPAATTTSS